MDRRPTRLLALSLLAALPLLGARAPVARGDDPAPDEKAAVLAVLGQLALASPIVTDTMIVFPIIAPVEPDSMGVVPVARTGEVQFEEPAVQDEPYGVLARNTGDKPALILGGTVLVGGERDRLVRRDVLLAPGAELEIEALPAASSSDIRKEPIPFEVSATLAPGYLRKRADFGGSASLVPTFVARYLDLRNEGDTRKSLQAISESAALRDICEPCFKGMVKFPTMTFKGQVTGAIAAYRGRLGAVGVFGAKDLLQAFTKPHLQGLAYAAAAIDLRAKKAGVPLPGRGDPDRTLEIVEKEAQELLARLAKATLQKAKSHEGEAGASYAFRLSDGSRGRVTVLDGKLVHLTVYPYDPFEEALYGAALELTDPEIASDPEREGVAELARREALGARLTPAEERLLDRLRSTGGGINLPGGAAGGPLVPGGGGLGPRR